jgi:hypothetical protein
LGYSIKNKILKSRGAEPGIVWMPRELEQDKLKKEAMDRGEQGTFIEG